MAQVAIVDDNADQRGTLRKTLSIYLKKAESDLKIIEQFPFEQIEQYFDFIQKNDICALIVDERLNDQADTSGKTVNYKGNELVGELRKRLKDFPIYMITTHSGDAEVRAKEGSFDDLLDRTEITEEENTAALFVSRLIRSVHRYLDSNKKELSEFNELTQLVSSGEHAPNLIEKLQALQVKLEMPFSGYDERNAWLEQYKGLLDELEKVNNAIKEKLNK